MTTDTPTMLLDISLAFDTLILSLDIFVVFDTDCVLGYICGARHSDVFGYICGVRHSDLLLDISVEFDTISHTKLHI